ESSEARRIEWSGVVEASARNTKCVPSGRKRGQTWVSSRGASFVAGLAGPPVAAMRCSGPYWPAEKRISPRELQLPPPRRRAAARTRGGPPHRAILLKL